MYQVGDELFADGDYRIPLNDSDCIMSSSPYFELDPGIGNWTIKNTSYCGVLLQNSYSPIFQVYCNRSAVHIQKCETSKEMGVFRDGRCFGRYQSEPITFTLHYLNRTRANSFNENHCDAYNLPFNITITYSVN